METSGRQTTSSVAEPGRLVAELAGKLGPGGVADGTGQVPVADEVGDGKVFQTEPVVSLDELAGDLMEEASADVGDAGVLCGTAAGSPSP